MVIGSKCNLTFTFNERVANRKLYRPNRQIKSWLYNKLPYFDKKIYVIHNDSSKLVILHNTNVFIFLHIIPSFTGSPKTQLLSMPYILLWCQFFCMPYCLRVILAILKGLFEGDHGIFVSNIKLVFYWTKAEPLQPLIIVAMQLFIFFVGLKKIKQPLSSLLLTFYWVWYS